MWSFECPDWQERLKKGRTLVPDLPLDEKEAARAVKAFSLLRLPDVPGRPRLGEAAGPWQKDIVRAIFGSLTPEGVRRVPELFAMVPKKNSKALALDTEIATPDGFKSIGEIAVGDTVIDANGKPTRVREKSVVFIGRPCFEVEFSTGETVVCDAEHLWVTDAHRDRDTQPGGRTTRDRKRGCPSAKTTAEIARSLTVPSGKHVINNHRTAICGSLDLPERPLPIPPYALGVWLGDGASEQAIVTAGCSEVDEMAERLVACGQPSYVRARYPEKGSATIALTTKGASPSERLPYRFRTEAVRLGLIGDKHIPRSYLRAAEWQRLELLRGLMDTDGNISIRGQASFTTTSDILRDGVIELVASLGFKPCLNTWQPSIRGRESECARAWRVSFFPYEGRPVFKMARKSERQKSRPSRLARSTTRQIVAVRSVPSVPTQCIGVESETKQFLVTRSLIPTHNTTGGAAIMLTAMIMNDRPRAEFILVGPTQEVADLAFQQAAGMIDADETGYLQARFRVQEHIKTIVDETNKAKLKVKTFDLKVMTGAKPAGVLVDELHQISTNSFASRVLRQIRGGIIANPEAFLIFITTQSDEPPSGVFKAELQHARAVRDGRVKEGRMLPVLYEFSEEEQTSPAKPWLDPKNWPQVLPNLGLSITLDRLVSDFEEAKQKGEEEVRIWASQHLNVEIGLALHNDRWRGADYWEAAHLDGLTLEELLRRSEVVTVGIDGGGLDDMLGLAVLGRTKGTHEWLLWNHAWVQEKVLDLRPEISEKLHDFEADGDLTVCESPTQDVTELADIVQHIAQAGLLPEKLGVGLDPYAISAIVDALAQRGVEGETLSAIRQGSALSPASWGMERKLADGTLWHAGQAMMAWCVGNARTEQRGNAVLITKQTAGKAKIDPLVAAFNAVMLMSRNPLAVGSSFWESAAA
jgi:phage terminase large subunit-like protein